MWDCTINHHEDDHIDKPRYRHDHIYSKYKKRLTMMMLICIKEHLSKMWSSIRVKVKQLWGWVEALLIKKCVDYLLESLEKPSKDLDKGFDDNFIKSNHGNCHLLVSSREKLTMDIDDFKIENSTCE